MRVVSLGLVSLALLLSSTALAEVPNRAHFNGYLNNAAGDPIDCPDAVQCVIPVNIGFALYDSEDSEVPLWEESHTAVPIYQGSFHVDLGSLISMDPASAGNARYLGVSINGGPEMLPRLSLSSSVFAMHAGVAETATDADNAAQLGGMEPTHYATSDSVTLLETGLAPIATTGDFTDLTNVPAGLTDGDDNTQLDEDQVDAFVANNDYSTGEHTVDTTLDEAQVDAMVANNDYSTGAHTVDTTLDEAQVDAMVANNGYSTGAHTVNTTLDEAQVDAMVANNGYSTGAHTVNTTLDEAQVDAMVANNGYSTGAHTVNTTLDEGQVDAMVANNGYALQADVDTLSSGLATVASTGLYADLLSAPWIDNAGLLEHNGTLSIISPGNSQNILLGSKDAFDEAEKGQLSIHDPEGDVSALVNIGTDGAGMVSLYGPNGELNFALWNWLGSPDRPLLGLHGETGEKRLLLEITEEDAGRTLSFGPNGTMNTAIWFPATDPDDGMASIFDDSGTEKATLGVTSSNAGHFQLYGPNGTHNFSMWHYGSTPDMGVFEVYDDANVVHASLGVTDEYAGFLGLTGASGNQLVRLGAPGSTPDRGSITLYNAAESVTAWLQTNSTESGQLILYGPTGGKNIALWNYGGRPDDGLLSLYDDTENPRVVLDITADNAGKLLINGPNGTKNLQVSHYGGAASAGLLQIYGSDNSARVDLYASSDHIGIMNLYGPNGERNIWNGYLAGYPEHGLVTVHDGSGSMQAGIYVDNNGNGLVFGDVKSFRMEHPEDQEKEIWYACIEGPEAAAYARGTATLVNGHARVELPEHFRLVAAEQGLTVTVTPLSADSKGMAVVEKTPAGFRVRELMSGRGTYSFDWEIKGVRRGYEDYQVIRPAMKLAGGVEPAPEDVNTDPNN